MVHMLCRKRPSRGPPGSGANRPPPAEWGCHNQPVLRSCGRGVGPHASCLQLLTLFGLSWGADGVLPHASPSQSRRGTLEPPFKPTRQPLDRTREGFNARGELWPSPTGMGPPPLLLTRGTVPGPGRASWALLWAPAVRLPGPCVLPSAWSRGGRGLRTSPRL